MGEGLSVPRSRWTTAASRGPCAVELLPPRGAGWRAGPGVCGGNKARTPRTRARLPSRTHRGCRRNRPSCGESAGLGAQRGGHFIQQTEWPPPILTTRSLTSSGAAPSLGLRRLFVRPSVRSGSVGRSVSCSRPGHFPVRLRSCTAPTPARPPSQAAAAASAAPRPRARAP
jgi:hypothetical protein